MNLRQIKTYNGEMMHKAKTNENIILDWLKTKGKSIIDFREFRLAQRIDVDFGIETLDGKIVLAEVKSDKWISEKGNLLFENNRINHFVKDHWFYLGWGWRSPAQKLIIRNPMTCDTFLFDFLDLRILIAEYIAKEGKNTKLTIIETDDQKTTFCLLIPMFFLRNIYKKYVI